MDIIHLLEVLNPLENVVTVKIDNDKNLFTMFGDLLITLAPAVIAGIAMVVSYKQFKTSLHRQSEQFELGIKQQINTLKINTQLATEVELMKEDCKALRETYVSYLDITSLLYRNQCDFKNYSGQLDDDAIKNRNVAHENIMTYSSKFLQTRILLFSYLNLEIPEEKKLQECIIAIGDCTFNGDGTGKDIGKLQGDGAILCFELIKRKRQAIFSLVETITD
ncbi:hypothetical protein ACHHZC_11700 [Citrobacter freundii complex sp. 2024EL-00228]|uniref:hypothetical protein n=1 Tax=Citrobacter freundii complex TaxID=1344959 RepID=UPI00070A73B9|nr:hypothetical protein [Citrobacter freundii]EJC8215931.1 hypothetical protein [Citrobacter freundii]